MNPARKKGKKFLKRFGAKVGAKKHVLSDGKWDSSTGVKAKDANPGIRGES